MSTSEHFGKAMEAPSTCPISLDQLETMLSDAGDGLIPVTSSYYQEIAMNGLLDEKFLFEGYGPLAEHMSTTLRVLSGVTPGGWIEAMYA